MVSLYIFWWAIYSVLATPLLILQRAAAAVASRCATNLATLFLKKIIY